MTKHLNLCTSNKCLCQLSAPAGSDWNRPGPHRSTQSSFVQLYSRLVCTSINRRLLLMMVFWCWEAATGSIQDPVWVMLVRCQASNSSSSWIISCWRPSEHKHRGGDTLTVDSESSCCYRSNPLNYRDLEVSFRGKKHVLSRHQT